MMKATSIFVVAVIGYNQSKLHLVYVGWQFCDRLFIFLILVRNPRRIFFFYGMLHVFHLSGKCIFGAIIGMPMRRLNRL